MRRSVIVVLVGLSVASLLGSVGHLVLNRHSRFLSMLETSSGIQQRQQQYQGQDLKQTVFSVNPGLGGLTLWSPQQQLHSPLGHLRTHSSRNPDDSSSGSGSGSTVLEMIAPSANMDLREKHKRRPSVKMDELNTLVDKSLEEIQDTMNSIEQTYNSIQELKQRLALQQYNQPQPSLSVMQQQPLIVGTTPLPLGARGFAQVMVQDGTRKSKASKEEEEEKDWKNRQSKANTNFLRAVVNQLSTM